MFIAILLAAVTRANEERDVPHVEEKNAKCQNCA